MNLEKKAIYMMFERLLSYNKNENSNDLIKLYGNGISYVKNNYPNRTKDEKTIAMYYLRQSYLKDNSTVDKIEKTIDDFFVLYDKEFQKYKASFELIFDETYLLLSFAYHKC
jgi:hypothetical protein